MFIDYCCFYKAAHLVKHLLNCIIMARALQAIFSSIMDTSVHPAKKCYINSPFNFSVILLSAQSRLIPPTFQRADRSKCCNR